MKLVRDRVGDLPWPAPGYDPTMTEAMKHRHLGWVPTDSTRYRDLLRSKLVEECAELLKADGGNPGAVLEEAADVFEVLRALLLANGCATLPSGVLGVLQDAAERKYVERGGFFQGRTWSGPERAGHPAILPDVHAGDGTLGQRLAKAAEAHTLPLRHILEDPAMCSCPVDPDGPERGDPLSTCPIHGWVVTRCVNDTDGDGDCPACARNPQAPCRQPKTAEVAEWWTLPHGTLVRDAAGNLRKVTRADGHPHLNRPPSVWLDHWSDEYAPWVDLDGPNAGKIADMGDGAARLPVTVVGRLVDGHIETAPTTGPTSTESAPDASEVPQDTPEAPGGSEAVERVWGHPLQYAVVGKITIVHSEHMTDDQVRAAAGPAGASGLPIERFNRCPTCEEWSPCEARRANPTPRGEVVDLAEAIEEKRATSPEFAAAFRNADRTRGHKIEAPGGEQ